MFLLLKMKPEPSWPNGCDGFFIMLTENARYLITNPAHFRLSSLSLISTAVPTATYWRKKTALLKMGWKPFSCIEQNAEWDWNAASADHTVWHATSLWYRCFQWMRTNGLYDENIAYLERCPPIYCNDSYGRKLQNTLWNRVCKKPSESMQTFIQTLQGHLSAEKAESL